MVSTVGLPRFHARGIIFGVATVGSNKISILEELWGPINGKSLLKSQTSKTCRIEILLASLLLVPIIFISYKFSFLGIVTRISY